MVDILVARGGSEDRPTPGSGPGTDRPRIMGPGPDFGFLQKCCKTIFEANDNILSKPTVFPCCDL